MKVYNLNIDASKPIRQVLNVPAKSSKYGIAVKATADGMRIANPHCQLIINGSAIQPVKTLDDGSFLFELTSDMVQGAHEVMVHIVNMDEISAQGDSSGVAVFFIPKNGDESKTNLDRATRMLNLVWYYGTAVDSQGNHKIFSDDEQITFTDDATIGQYVTKKVGQRLQKVWEDLATIPKGKYYTKELDRVFFGGGIGRVADCKVPVVLNEVLNPITSEELEDKNVVCDTLTVDGMKYQPTTLSVDGVEYKVLAEVQAAPEPEPEPEPTEGE